MNAVVCRVVRLRECPLRELTLYLDLYQEASSLIISRFERNNSKKIDFRKVGFLFITFFFFFYFCLAFCLESAAYIDVRHTTKCDWM